MDDPGDMDGPGCLVCGAEIMVRAESEGPFWMTQFRNIYAESRYSAEAHLSGPAELLPGVGTRRFVSLDSPDDQETLMGISFLRSKFLSQVNEHEHPDAWGFPVHCCCWAVLNVARFFGRKDLEPHHAVFNIATFLGRKDLEPHHAYVPIQPLFDVCRSLPLATRSRSLLDFGHSYGDLGYRSESHFPLFPGEEKGLQLHGRLNDPNRDPNRDAHISDPLDATVFFKALFKAIKIQQRLSRESLSCSIPTNTMPSTPDPFGKIPPELRAYIFLYLDSPDVLNLKLSSRVMTNTQLSDRFWHSRLLPSLEPYPGGGKYDHLWEFYVYALCSGRWKDVFLSVHKLRNHPFLKNRRRIWDLALVINHHIDLADGPCLGMVLRSWFEPLGLFLWVPWVSASRNLKDYHEYMDLYGCRSLYERLLAFPDEPSRICIATRQLCTGSYISGIQIWDRHRTNVQEVGYTATSSRHDLTIKGCSDSIVGFHLAQDQRGIRGIKILLDGNQQASSWIGDHHGLPRRRLILRSDSGSALDIKYLKAGFDACKMVSLGIAERGSVHRYPGESTLTLRAQDTLHAQDTELWYPDTPDPELSFFGAPEQDEMKNYEDQARPFQTALFSDTEGIHLPFVESIKVWSTKRLDFTFLAIDLGKPLQDGRSRIRLGMEEGTLEILQDELCMKEHSFTLNSASGERIMALDVRYELHVGFIGFTIHTNRRRCAELPPHHTAEFDPDNVETRRLWPKTGNIVGFYGVVSNHKGIEALGIACTKDATYNSIAPVQNFPPGSADESSAAESESEGAEEEEEEEDESEEESIEGDLGEET